MVWLKVAEVYIGGDGFLYFNSNMVWLKGIVVDTYSEMGLKFQFQYGLIKRI